jgi:ribonuclease HI
LTPVFFSYYSSFAKEKTMNDIHVVIYVDGSARPNPGHVGWGCHGYLYSQVSNEVKDRDVYETDQGFLLKDAVELSSGAAQCVEVLKYIDLVGPVFDTIGTNNIAEVCAFYESILTIQEYVKANDGKIKSWLIYTDSEYVRKGVTEYLHIWKRNNWVKQDGSIVKNKDLWLKVDLLVKDIVSIKVPLQIRHIDGHRGYPGNTQADYLAVIAMNMSTCAALGEEIDKKYLQLFSDKKQYWRESKSIWIKQRNPLLTFKRIYFNSLENTHLKGHYYLVDSGTKGKNHDAMSGKRTAEASFSIVKLHTPDPMIEMIMNRQIKGCQGDNIIAAVLMDVADSNEIAMHLEMYGDHAMQFNKRNYNLEFLDKRVITMNLIPSNLTPRALQTLNHLETVLNSVNIDSIAPKHEIVEIFTTDITEHFFAPVKKKIELKKEFGVGVKSTQVYIKHTDENNFVHELKVPLVMGLDLPDRNALSKIAKNASTIAVKLVAWLDSCTALSYAVYIKYDEGYGIWSNAFSNKIYIPPSK